MPKKYFSFVLLLFSILLSGCGLNKPLTVSDFALNTYVSITVYGKSNETIANEALKKIKYYEDIFSKTKQGTQVYTLNQNKFIAYADDDLYKIISKGIEYGKLTDGNLDISIGSLTNLWDVTNSSHAPDNKEIKKALLLVDYNNIKCLADNKIVLENDTQIDLGAISKGFIADKIRNYLIENGITSGIINLGGNIMCIGSKPGNNKYVVGIQKPFGNADEVALSLDIADKSVVTSGIYERYFIENDTIYHHVIDPNTGYPADNGLYSVTIISDDSLTGDCLSTACLVMGKEKGLELINSLDNVYAIFIDNQMQFYYSDGARSFLH